MPRTRTYLDHAATTPLRPEARTAIDDGFALWANPSSPHAEGRKAREALESARERVAAALGWQGHVIFTSGASEALALGLRGGKTQRQLISAVEHDAVLRAAPRAEVIPVGKDWLVDRGALAEGLARRGRAIAAIQHVNSETGTIQPVSELSAIMRESGGLLISDCSQSAGKMPLPDADMIVVSAHKLGGPVGIGALLVKDFAMLDASGGQERGYRAGTENLPGAMGFAAALEARDWASTDDQRAAFKASLGSAGKLLGGSQTASHIIAAAHPGMAAQVLLIRLDAMGFAVSAGSACSSGSLKRGRVLEGFGVDEGLAARTIRISPGWDTRPEQLEVFAKVWADLCRI